MEFICEATDGKSANVRIGGTLTAYDLAELREKLLVCMENNDEVLMNLDDVTECDTAGIQMLCSARKKAAQDNTGFEVIGVSAHIRNFADRIGLDMDDALNLSDDI